MDESLPKVSGTRGTAAGPPRVESYTLGPYETNCYVVSTAGSTACWIIDAGFEPAALIEGVRAAGLRPAALILTHTHLDHIAGVREVLGAFPGLEVFVHEAEAEWLGDPLKNLSALSGMPVTAPEADGTLRDGARLTLGESEWELRHTPGHSPGGVTLYHAGRESGVPGVALVGDTLFAGSVGRTDFPGSDPDTLTRSIRERLYTLPEDTIVYPGHGAPTTIGLEKASNPFVRGK